MAGSGHPEPGAVIGDDINEDGGIIGDGSNIVKELFDAPLREVAEETNIPAETLHPPQLLGIFYDDRLKPDMLFTSRTTLTAAQVQEVYLKGAVDAFESTRLEAVSIHSRPSFTLVPPSHALVELWKEIFLTAG